MLICEVILDPFELAAPPIGKFGVRQLRSRLYPISGNVERWVQYYFDIQKRVTQQVYYYHRWNIHSDAMLKVLKIVCWKKMNAYNTGRSSCEMPRNHWYPSRRRVWFTVYCPQRIPLRRRWKDVHIDRIFRILKLQVQFVSNFNAPQDCDNIIC